uniref:Uncharacterized protein n=1 Tax=Arundo donax TaxID=35708 RepID=A0A0A9GVR8_ARUDO
MLQHRIAVKGHISHCIRNVLMVTSNTTTSSNTDNFEQNFCSQILSTTLFLRHVSQYALLTHKHLPLTLLFVPEICLRGILFIIYGFYPCLVKDVNYAKM